MLKDAYRIRHLFLRWFYRLEADEAHASTLPNSPPKWLQLQKTGQQTAANYPPKCCKRPVAKTWFVDFKIRALSFAGEGYLLRLIHRASVFLLFLFPLCLRPTIQRQRFSKIRDVGNFSALHVHYSVATSKHI